MTEDKAYWKLPSNTKVTYEQVTKINFQSAKTKKRTAEAILQGEVPPSNRFKPAKPLEAQDLQSPSQAE